MITPRGGKAGGGVPAPVAVTDRQDRLSIDPAAVTDLVRFALAAEGAHGAVEVTFVDDATIADLHLRFMDIPGPTDVITFPLDDDELDPGDGDAAEGDAGEGAERAPALLGEIVVSTDTACRQAPEYGLDPLDEALLYVVHGVLHLLGYDDHAEDEAERMAARQRELLVAWQDAR